MKRSNQLTLKLSLLSLVALLGAVTSGGPADAHDLAGSQMKKEIRFEQKLAGNQYYNMYAPYLEPGFAPSPGVVNGVMRVF